MFVLDRSFPHAINADNDMVAWAKDVEDAEWLKHLSAMFI
jgi:hypothetical protein